MTIVVRISCNPMRPVCSTHLVLFGFNMLTIFGEEYKLWRFPLHSFINCAVTSFFVSPNIILSTLFSNTLSLCSFPNVRDLVLHLYQTTGKKYCYITF
jgi:hypothetical protein